jgi:phospholipid/cholesterol/gamma-HCH transport system substrate-binding protein
MTMNIRRTSGLLVLAMLGLTACGPTLGSLPLPGKGVSGDTMHVTMLFGDALNLAQGAPVKVNGVDEGKVQKIWVQDYHAVADVVIKTDAHLRATMTARLRYTTPLGELYVDITNPATGDVLQGGATIPLAATTTAPTVEDALSSAGLLINGGGLGAIEKISTELKHAFVGKEPVWRDLLTRLNDTVTQANASTKDFGSALTALQGVSATLGKNKAVIDRALKEIAPAAAVLRSETPNLTQLLLAVQKFGTQANATLTASKSDLLTTLAEVQPVLAELTANKAQWAASLNSLVTAARVVQTIIPGDYLNLGGALNLTAGALGSVGGGTTGGGTGTGGTTGGTGGGGIGGIIGGVTGGTIGTGSGLCVLGICVGGGN